MWSSVNIFAFLPNSFEDPERTTAFTDYLEDNSRTSSVSSASLSLDGKEVNLKRLTNFTHIFFVAEDIIFPYPSLEYIENVTAQEQVSWHDMLKVGLYGIAEKPEVKLRPDAFDLGRLIVKEKVGLNLLGNKVDHYSIPSRSQENS